MLHCEAGILGTGEQPSRGSARFPPTAAARATADCQHRNSALAVPTTAAMAQTRAQAGKTVS